MTCSRPLSRQSGSCRPLNTSPGLPQALDPRTAHGTNLGLDPRHRRGPAHRRSDGMSARLDAHGLIELVLDDGTFTCWDTPVDTLRASTPPTRTSCAGTARGPGVDESVVTGAGRIRGHAVAVIVGEFGFLGGLDRAGHGPTGSSPRSSGRPASGCRCWPRRPRAAPGCRRARRRSSDGADLRGGRAAQGRRPALPRVPAAPDHRRGLRVVGLARPRDRRRAGRAHRLPRPPRLRGARTATPFPAGVQTAENLADKGIIDAVVAAEDLARVAGRVLRPARPPRRRVPAGRASPTRGADPAAVDRGSRCC